MIEAYRNIVLDGDYPSGIDKRLRSRTITINLDEAYRNIVLDGDYPSGIDKRLRSRTITINLDGGLKKR